MTSNICGIILAGGKSSRMGTNKAYLKFEQQDFLAHTSQLLIASKIDTIIVSGNYANYSCIPDLKPHYGPAAAIMSVWKNLNTYAFKKLVICAVDMPLITPLLIEMLIKHSEQYEAVFFSKNFLPCCIHSLALKKLEQYNFDHQALQTLLSQLDFKELPIPPAQQKYFCNINTPTDWHDLRTLK